MSKERCATCGEPIPDGEAVFDLFGGRIGLSYHQTCQSIPTPLKAKLSVCPVCGHMEGRHMDCDFDETTVRITSGRHTLCAYNGCGCDWYMGRESWS